MSGAFAEHFRARVAPDLRCLCEGWAWGVAADLSDFLDAHSAVMREAYKRGAGHLPQELEAELDSWVAITLCDAVATAMPGVKAHKAMLDRVWDDLRRCGIV